MIVKFKDRKVKAWISHSADVVDSFIDSAQYSDTGEELIEEELDELTEQMQLDGSMYEDYMQHHVERAEDLLDRVSDR